MKNFKKVLSLVLAFAMVLSTMTVAFAATNDDKAEVLYKLGLFKGVSTTEFEPALDQETDAAQAIALIGRALEWDIDKDATVAFTDVPDWAVPYIAYAVDAKITNGVSDTTFGTEYIDGQRMVAWTLRALGYDMTEAWDKTEELADEAGLMIPQGKLRDDVVAVIYEALTSTPVGSDMTLIESLVEGDAQLRAVAEAEGLISPVPEDLEVVDVEGVNLIQVAIEYSNTEYDKDEVDDKANYEFEGEIGGKKDKDIDVVDVDVDGTTVLLTLAEAVDNQTKGTLTIDKVVGDTDKDVEIKDIEFIDRTFPEIEDVKVVGEDTVKFIFSEPIKLEPNSDNEAASKYEDEFEFKLDGKTYNVDQIDVINNGMEANVVVYGTFKEGTLEIKVGNGLKDYANFNVPTKDYTLEVVPDEEDPYVTGYKEAKNNTVTLIFNEDIVRKSSDEKDFYHTNDSSSNIVDDAEQDSSVSIDGNEMKLTFKSDLPEIAYVYVGTEAVADLWNNKNDSTIKVRVETTVDKTAPEVKEVKATSSELTIKFDEEVDEDIAEDLDNYTVLDSDGDEVSIRSAEYKDTDKDHTVTIKPRKSTFEDGTYTVLIEDIEDVAGNKMSDVTESFKIDDESAPTIKTLDGTNGNFGYVKGITTTGTNRESEVYIYFSEELMTSGKYDATDLANYSYKLNGVSDSFKTLEEIDDMDDYDVEIDLVDNNKTVKITIEGDKNVDTGTNLFRVGRLADLEGNYMGYSTDIELALLSSKTIGIKETEATKRDEVKVTFTNDLDSVKEEDFIVTDGTTPITVDSLDVKDGDEVVLKLNKDLPFDPETANYKVITRAANLIESEDSNGVKLGEITYASSTKLVMDKIAPEVAKDDDVNVNKPYKEAGTTDDVERVYATTDNANTNPKSTVKIVFTEPVTYVTQRSFEFTNDDLKITSATVSGSVVTLAVDGIVLKGDTIDQLAPIYDANGNSVDDLDLRIEYPVVTTGGSFLSDVTVAGVAQAASVTVKRNESAKVNVNYTDLGTDFQGVTYHAYVVADGKTVGSQTVAATEAIATNSGAAPIEVTIPATEFATTGTKNFDVYVFATKDNEWTQAQTTGANVTVTVEELFQNMMVSGVTAPATTTVVDGSNATMNVTFDSLADATGYEVYVVKNNVTVESRAQVNDVTYADRIAVASATTSPQSVTVDTSDLTVGSNNFKVVVFATDGTNWTAPSSAANVGVDVLPALADAQVANVKVSDYNGTAGENLTVTVDYDELNALYGNLTYNITVSKGGSEVATGTGTSVTIPGSEITGGVNEFTAVVTATDGNVNTQPSIVNANSTFTITAN